MTTGPVHEGRGRPLKLAGWGTRWFFFFFLTFTLTVVWLARKFAAPEVLHRQGVLAA